MGSACSSSSAAAVPYLSPERTPAISVESSAPAPSEVPVRSSVARAPSSRASGDRAVCAGTPTDKSDSVSPPSADRSRSAADAPCVSEQASVVRTPYDNTAASTTPLAVGLEIAPASAPAAVPLPNSTETPLPLSSSVTAASPATEPVQCGTALPAEWTQVPNDVDMDRYLPPDNPARLDRLPLGVREAVAGDRAAFARLNLLSALDDPDLIVDHRAALLFVNAVRAALGLPLLQYSAALSRQGAAHSRYTLEASRHAAHTVPCFHWEDPALPFFSREGDEVARRAGVGHGWCALAAIHSLLQGPFHRLQFLAPGSGSIGAGYVPGSVAGVFPTQYSDGDGDGGTGDGMDARDRRHRPGAADSPLPYDAARFVVYPPPGFMHADPVFVSEWPDPRVGGTGRAGTMLSVTMRRPEDVRSFRRVTVELRDESASTDWPLRWTDPRNPAQRHTPADELRAILGPDTKADATIFQDNVGSVIAYPTQYLPPGHTFSVRARLEFDSGPVQIDWTFGTRPVSTWHVDAETEALTADAAPTGLPVPGSPVASIAPNPHPFSLYLVMRSHQPEDCVLLGPGDHHLRERAQLSRPRLLGGCGMDRTRLHLSTQLVLTEPVPGVRTVLSGLEIRLAAEMKRGPALVVLDGLQVVLRRVRLVGAAHIELYPGASVEFEECDLSQVGDLLVFCHDHTCTVRAPAGRNFFAGRPGLVAVRDCADASHSSSGSGSARPLRAQPWTWTVVPQPAPEAREHDLVYALQNALPGDTVQCGPGVFELREPVTLCQAELVVRGAGSGGSGGRAGGSSTAEASGGTVLCPAPVGTYHNALLVASGARLVFHDLAVDVRRRSRLFDVLGGGAVRLQRVAVWSDGEDDLLFQGRGDAEISLQACDLRECRARVLGVLQDSSRLLVDADAADADSATQFGFRAPRVHAAATGTDSALRSKDREWLVRPDAAPDSEQSLERAIRSASDGDVIRLAAGRYVLRATAVVGNASMHGTVTVCGPAAEGGVAGAAIVQRAGPLEGLRLFHVRAGAALVLRDVTLDATDLPMECLGVQGGARLRLDRVRVVRAGQHGLCDVQADCVLTLHGCDLSAFAFGTLALLRTPTARVVLEPGNRFGERHPQLLLMRADQSTETVDASGVQGAWPAG